MSTVEKRLAGLEYIVGHLPEDLDARFAGVDTKLAAIREVLALHSTRFTTVEHKVDALAVEIVNLKADVGGLKTDVGGLKTDVGGIKADVGGLKAEVATLASETARRFAGIESQLAELLQRLPRS